MGSMLLLAIIIVIVSGVIAYVGDLVGRKMGRKRLTLFGLRPKHTAIVISSGVGMLIAFLTLTATFLISNDVQTAFTKLDVIRNDMKDAQQQLQIAQKKAINTTEKLEEETRKLNTTRLELGMTKDLLAKSKVANNEIQQRLSTAKTELQAVQARLDKNQRQLKEAKVQYIKAQSQLNVANGQLSTATKKVVEATKKINNLQTEEHRLTAQRDELQVQITVFSVLASSTFEPPVFTSGQEILTGLVSVSATKDQRKSYLRQFIQTADKVVHAQCKDLPAESAGLIFLGGSDKTPVKYDTTDAAVNALNARIEGLKSREDVILRLSPINNMPSSGQALIFIDRLELIPNSLVFSANGDVARLAMNVSGKTNDAEVLGGLADTLLREKLPAAMRAKQMIMITRRFDPANPESALQPSGSLVSWADLMRTVDHIKRHTGRVNVIVRNKSAIYRYDPLAISLEVEAGDS